MCLYPRYILNKKYLPNKKNGGRPPVCPDERLRVVPIACGKCMECCKAKAREWQVRLSNELRYNKEMIPKFVTLTFSEEALNQLGATLTSEEICKLSVKLFRERWRKKYKKSIRHWLVSELGHNGTERIHMHGILWVTSEEQTRDIEKIWKYGWVYIGEYVNQKTVNYIVKYVNKIDVDHKNYTPTVLASPGVGAAALSADEWNRKQMYNMFRGNQTNEMYTLPNGAKVPLPIYFRNKIYSEAQREQLWLKKLDEQVRYVNGVKVDISKEYNTYIRVLQKAQEDNRVLGYGDDGEEWKKQTYLASAQRINNYTKKKNITNQKRKSEQEWEKLQKWINGENL